MLRGEDPILDFVRYEDEQQRRLDRLPRCCYCAEVILEEFCYEIGGEYVCEACLQEYHKRPIDACIW